MNYYQYKLGDRVIGANGVPGYVYAVHPSDDIDYYEISIRWENGKLSRQPNYLLDSITLIEYV